MDIVNGIIGFAVLSGPLWLIVLILPISILIAYVISKQFSPGGARIIVGVLVFLVLFFLPFSDEIAGRIYLDHLCSNKASVKIYQTFELPAEYWDEMGNPKYLSKYGFVDLSLLPDKFEWRNIEENYIDSWIRIDERRGQFFDKENQVVLGEKISYMRYFGWISILSPAPNIGETCRDLEFLANREEFFDKERMQDQRFFSEIFRPAEDL